MITITPAAARDLWRASLHHEAVLRADEAGHIAVGPAMLAPASGPLRILARSSEIPALLAAVVPDPGALYSPVYGLLTDDGAWWLAYAITLRANLA
ncbi:hypothetical protein [Streptomyces sp. GZWMJZ-114]|uniref:hypothetical protein n=1 Tax=Streptomyces sp. GZWMJZ-114 TaxID=2494734 RepID=UPI0010103AC0|nr:hypothetical protein [Streptomyces sp. GZWMJZ-114]